MKDKTHKLSKRNGDASFQDLMAKGYLPEAVINFIALLGWAPSGEYNEQEIFSMDELKKRSRSAASASRRRSLTTKNSVLSTALMYTRWIRQSSPRQLSRISVRP